MPAKKTKEVRIKEVRIYDKLRTTREDVFFPRPESGWPCALTAWILLLIYPLSTTLKRMRPDYVEWIIFLIVAVIIGILSQLRFSQLANAGRPVRVPRKAIDSVSHDGCVVTLRITEAGKPIRWAHIELFSIETAEALAANLDHGTRARRYTVKAIGYSQKSE